MRYKDTLDKIARGASKITYPEPLSLMLEINAHFLSYFYVTYDMDSYEGISIVHVEIDSFAPEFMLFGIEPLSEVLDKFIIECLESM